ncbi:hypothetical protein DV737_g5693, partial [Chaetothyriales sp. CBS 132003]
MPELNASAIATATNNPDSAALSSSAGQNKTQPYSDQKHLRSSRKASAQTTKRDTHFICFPLVTDHSIPQLAASLARFRRATTITPEITPETRRDGDEECNEDEPEDELKILPAVVHRPPGTFHLTIGTMDLSEKSEKERAVRVLKGLDLRGMLADVEREVGLYRVVTKGDEKKGDEKKGDEKKGDEKKGDEKKGGPQHARVFYAPPIDPSRRLLSLANKIRAVFKAQGFVTETRELTLHATVANMRIGEKKEEEEAQVWF